MKTLSLIVLVLSFTFTAPVTAMDKDKAYASHGNISCGQWAKDRKTDAAWNLSVDYTWIAGYITAYNRQTPDVYQILGSTDIESVYLWIDSFYGIGQA